VGLIRAFLVLFQKIDSPQHDTWEMVGFVNRRIAGPPAAWPVLAGQGGKRP
jgi:hypothetical protein